MTPTCSITDSDGEILLTVAIPHERDMSRLLDLVVDEAAIEMVRARQMLSVETAGSVMCQPYPVTRETARMVWEEIRSYFVSPRAVAS